MLDSVIREKGLELKYIFVTHCHPDHVYGVPAMKKKYPGAKLCFSREEWEDSKRYGDWEKELNPELVAGIKQAIEKNPQLGDVLNFDYDRLGKPDIFLEDNQVLHLGKLKIRALLTPGHSRGSVCFHAGNVLFSGDVLFYRLVGRTDLPTGSPEDIVKSVRRLYDLLPDETKVYPGHGEFTDIKSEKAENKEVSLKTVSLQN
jgi:glyoxylase-like metal-dependent hydrolase (beta-lactamase superfamily II)